MEKGTSESFTQATVQLVSMKVEILHHSASDARFAGRGNLMNTNGFAGVQMCE